MIGALALVFLVYLRAVVGQRLQIRDFYPETLEKAVFLEEGVVRHRYVPRLGMDLLNDIVWFFGRVFYVLLWHFKSVKRL